MVDTRQLLITLAWRLAMLAIVVPAIALAVWGSARLGPTFDEPADITAGYVLWRSGKGLAETARPPLGPMLESLGLWVTWGEDVDDWPGLPERDVERLTAHVLGGDVPVMRMLWWARIPGLLATFLTALLVHRGALALWASEAAALLAVALFCLLPSTLAHAARADGAALAGLWLLAATLAGWRWLRGHDGGRPALGFALAALLTDWALWVLIPFALVLDLIARGVRARTAQPTPPPAVSPPVKHPRRAPAWLSALVSRVRVPVGHALLLALGLWFAMIVLTGNWTFWWDLWRSAQVHWAGRHDEVLPLFFHGGFHHGRPAMYQPALLLLKTPLWLPLIWGLALQRVWAERRWQWSLIALHAMLAWVLIAGALFFPPRGHEVWVPLLPLVCMIAGGAVGSRSLAASLPWRLRWLRRGAVVLALSAGLWTALVAAPHWHAQWNTLAWLSGGGRAWFAAPELDAGPAMPEVAERLRQWGEGDALVFVAHHGRWSPRALGLRCILLPSHGLLLESTRRFDVSQPPEGLCVIAASLLVGQDCLYPDTYRWFREHPAEAWIGSTVGIWRVHPP